MFWSDVYFYKVLISWEKVALIFEMCEFLELAGQGDLIFGYIIFRISIFNGVHILVLKFFAS